MTVEITVPALGESISEATVAKWFKSVGDAVAMDEPLVELETDKVTLEVNAKAAGTLVDIAAAAGENVAVGSLLGRMEEGASAPWAKPAAVSQPDAAPPLSPAVRRLTEEHNLAPSAIAATGKDGRLTKGDVLAHLDARPAPAAPVAATKPAARGEERVRMSRLRQRVAERLKEAQNTAAMLTTFNEVDMTAAMAARRRYREAFEKKHGVRLGFMSFFVKAAVIALKEIPEVNAAIDGTEIVYRNYCDIGVAVGTEQGLVVPVLRNADTLSFAAIEQGVAALGRKARDGKLAIEDLTGGTFSISNGGVYGSLLSTPILNPPQSGILGMHKIQDRAVVVDGAVAVRPMMYLALSYDHRIIDGREAVGFLVRIKDCIEAPERMLLDI